MILISGGIAPTNNGYDIGNSLLDLSGCQGKRQQSDVNKVKSIMKLLVERLSDIMQGQRYAGEIRWVLRIADIKTMEVSLAITAAGNSSIILPQFLEPDPMGIILVLELSLYMHRTG